MHNYKHSSKKRTVNYTGQNTIRYDTFTCAQNLTKWPA